MTALAVYNGLKLHQLTVTTALLNETLKEVYVKQPKEFTAEGLDRTLNM
jgi:hypothetical protein